MTRNRYRPGSTIGNDGLIRDYWNGVVFNTILGQEIGTLTSTARCEDDVGGDVNPLLITKSTASVSRLSGSADFSGPGYTYIRTFEGRVPTLFINHTVGHLSFSIPSEGSSLSTLLDRTNPGRSEVSIPTFVGELKDLPRLVRDIGNIAQRFRNNWGSSRNPLRASASARDFANYYLGTVFGIMPMISDIRKMLDFTARVDKRLDELRRLQQRGGISRKRNLGSGTTSDSSDVVINSLGGTFTARRTITTQWKRWASTRWTSSAPIPELSRGGQEARRYAFRLVTGLNSYGAIEAAWELLPWSWLTDWFGRFDNLIGSQNWSVPAHPTMSCVMTHIRTKESYHGVQPASPEYKDVSGGEATFTYETKARYVGSPTFNTNLPLFNGRQWSILGALAIQRYRG